MDRRGIAVAAFVIMLGTLTTSVLGFVRAFVIARLFGAGAETDAFFAALVVPQMFYDQLIGGAIAAALIPTFSRLSDDDGKEMWLVVRTVFALVGGTVVVLVLLLELVAHPLMEVVVSGFALKAHGGVLELSVRLVRVLLPSLLFMSAAAVALASLYSLRRRVVSAFAPACYHLGIIGAAVLGFSQWGITGLAAGAVVGAAAQFVVQVPVLVRAGILLRYRTSAASKVVWVSPGHPAVRRILILYLPVAAGLLVSIAGQIADLNFKSHLPQAGELTSMQYATMLVQFPVGIVAAALALAVLPSISVDAGAERFEGFKDTLALGIRLVLVLMVPAMVALLTLATPIVEVVFERGHFTYMDTVHTATALRGYAPQLPFVGIDQLLIFAFYARHNTLTPALVGVLGVVVYVLGAALLLVPAAIFGLALANTVQITVHAIVLFGLLTASLGPLRRRDLPMTILKVGVASAGMAVAALAVRHWLAPGGPGLVARVSGLLLPGTAAVIVYGVLVMSLRVAEARLILDMLAERVRLSR